MDQRVSFNPFTLRPGNRHLEIEEIFQVHIVIEVEVKCVEAGLYTRGFGRARQRERTTQARGEPWREALTDERLLVAVNQEVGDRQTAVADGDEVAWFPPVTGG